MMTAVALTFIKGKIQEKRFSPNSPSLSEIVSYVEEAFEPLQREEFALSSDGYRFTSDGAWSGWLGSRTDVTVQVQALALTLRGFSQAKAVNVLRRWRVW